MRLKDYKFLAVAFLLTFKVFSQNSISGNVVSSNGIKLDYVEIFDKTTGSKSFTNKEGSFVINVSGNGAHELVFYKEGYEIVEQSIASSAKNNTIVLDKLTRLSEVVISQQREKLSAIRKLKDIEGTAIYAGKKTEVVQLNKIIANKATNNARQIFSQVVGLTINESNDGGLQLSIGGRGLDPNRTSNFNTRQNGYDISADVLGYPESYYATPTEALEEIQIVRGAASLQYGTQFGGMINFQLKSPSKKEMEITQRLTGGSYDLFTSFTSLSGTNGKFSHYSFYNYKQGNGFRPNSQFDAKNFFTNLNYQISPKTSLHFDYTHFDYLAKQPGGLTDYMFNQDPTQSNRSRNWFDINWNLFALKLKHKFDNNADLSVQLFGLDASRKALGYRSNRVANPDTPGTERDLIIGDFVNWGTEIRYLKKYDLFKNNSAFLIGAKYYQSDNAGIQGAGSSGSDANFDLADDEFPFYGTQSSYKFPNLNVAVFGENIFRVSPTLSITPGFRYEIIKTQANGSYRRINRDLAGNVIFDETVVEHNVKERNFLLLGIGLSYKPLNGIEVYGNVSQNYRSVTFNDIRTASPSQAIDENITDESGYSSDIGVRGKIGNSVSFDVSGFALYYDDKIGEYETPNPNGGGAVVRFRDNIGTAITYGFESMIDWNLRNIFLGEKENIIWNIFTNASITESEYLKSDVPNVQGNKVEFVPLYNLKAGMGFGYKNFLSHLQVSYVSSEFTDAENHTTDSNDNVYGIFGKIPSYYVMDFSTAYKWKRFKLETGVNNLTNNWYFTRRATGYPGPGIIPSEPRTFYMSLEFVF
ncbi:TonB-dependent receptor [Flavobacterium amniphilum]|uniref:TonB-dependent receptor domain-containing protein n=1 Tax=Flavobacterium amniphilum TaxID=1834035 RepID=UPI00202A7DCC|nr:TonB-dependent receptor [Flavobacterium amniphilum]MCL9807258.1 TonB-dependent receptor [Flavobacterium amniphilum]